MKKIFIITIYLISVPVLATNKAKQVEDLFIWKISDELKLSVKEEKSFSEIIRKLNKEKLDLTNQMDQLTIELKDQKDNKKNQQILKKYKVSLQKYGLTSIQEIDKIEKLLGSERTAKYIVLKNDFTSKLKQLLSTSTDQTLNPDKNYNTTNSK